MYKLLSSATLILLLAVALTFGWLYVAERHDVSDLQDQIDIENLPASIIDRNVKTDPPNGQADTSTWSTAEDEEGRFTLQYPDNWAEVSSSYYLVVPKRLIDDDAYLNVPLSLISIMSSSNTDIPAWWRTIALANGEAGYYSFEDGFDHYHMVTKGVMLTLSVPSRDYDNLYTDQELLEATQIVNTLTPL